MRKKQIMNYHDDDTRPKLTLARLAISIKAAVWRQKAKKQAFSLESTVYDCYQRYH